MEFKLTSDLDTDQQSANTTRPPGQHNRDEGERLTTTQQDSNATSLGPRQMGEIYHWDQDKETGESDVTDVVILRVICKTTYLLSDQLLDLCTDSNCCAQHLTSLMNWKTRRNLREISATKKHIQCTFIERELLGFLWFEIILYKQRLIELFGSYVVTIHHTNGICHGSQKRCIWCVRYFDLTHGGLYL
ncbi:hypothetical protein PROFUN_01788 [Planoprotostelium fungivorum]|uniref:Uncharacterized protein n=1 Tax=Planoprotostelium fungivorum TaxID=1890364 RepID=A0A2P6MWH0_9EUKA|nr:hypothetical protein PROFUN_01788 [Planoprotostelium fungivorum]